MTYSKKSIAHISKGVLRIKKHKQSEWILLFVMLWPFLINFISNLPSPLNYAQYLCDGIMLYWCVGDLINKTTQTTRIRRDSSSLVFWVCGFLGYVIVTYMVNYQSAIYFLWGLRNNFRCYMLFFRIVRQVDEDDVNEWLTLLDTLFWINAVLSLFQFFIGGIAQDRLGGIFGIEAGTNGFTLILLSIVVVKSQIKLYEHEEKLWVCMAKSGMALLVAAMAEIKFYLLLFVFQMLLVAVLTKSTWKKVFAMLFCAVAVSVSMNLLAQWFSSSGKFDIAVVIEKAFQKHYASTKDLNRLSAIGTLSKDILKDPVHRIIGMGLGNCDSGNFSFLRTPFYERYSYLHYRWFSAPMMYVETGYIGLLFYIGFFLVCFWRTIKKIQRGTGNAFYNKMGIVFAVTSLLLVFYNASLRYEGGWMIYIILALPFVTIKESVVKT